MTISSEFYRIEPDQCSGHRAVITFFWGVFVHRVHFHLRSESSSRRIHFKRSFMQWQSMQSLLCKGLLQYFPQCVPLRGNYGDFFQFGTGRRLSTHHVNKACFHRYSEISKKKQKNEILRPNCIFLSWWVNWYGQES